MTIRAQIEATGGLATLAGLAERWGVSRARVDQLSHHPDFPAPIIVGSSRRPMMVFLVEEADRFRQAQLNEGKGTP